MSKNLVRHDFENDFEKYLNFNEYNETMRYANKNIEVKGVSEQIQNLMNEKENYISNVKNIINTEREKGNQKYQLWEKWNARNSISLRITMGLLAIIILNKVLSSFLPGVIHTILRIIGLPIYIMVPVSLVIMVITSSHEMDYNRYETDIIQKINSITATFSKKFKEYYTTIDDLYLCSLEPAHREMVIMHREQKEHNKEMLRLERERNRLEKERNEQMLRLEKERQNLDRERAEEAKRTRKATEDMLQIERDREWRSRR